MLYLAEKVAEFPRLISCSFYSSRSVGRRWCASVSSFSDSSLALSARDMHMIDSTGIVKLHTPIMINNEIAAYGAPTTPRLVAWFIVTLTLVTQVCGGKCLHTLAPQEEWVVSSARKLGTVSQLHALMYTMFIGTTHPASTPLQCCCTRYHVHTVRWRTKPSRQINNQSIITD
jgi:hypothetical protein